MNQNLLTRGRIFDIQRFSTHDGPGIRTLVFLKGCSLRCRWCCNPESQSYEIQQMVQNGKVKTVGRDVTVAEVMEEILSDRPYYKRSGGGMTLSGGEALNQPDFTEALLKECKAQGISTAIESTAFASREVIDRVLPYLDYFLMDIKHIDDYKHREFTTQSNQRILENARYIASKIGDRLIIRVPVIPTFNDSPSEIGEIARFAATLQGVKQIHLLPYHRMGYDKYVGLGREYKMGNITPPTAERMQELLRVAESYGLVSHLGG